MNNRINLPEYSSQAIDCIFPSTNGAQVELSFDSSMADGDDNNQARHQNWANDSFEFVVGMPFWTKFYTLFDLSSKTVSVYSLPEGRPCTRKAYRTTQRFLKTPASSTRSPGTKSPSKSPATKSPSKSPTKRPTTLRYV